MSLVDDLKRCLTLHHIINLLLSVAFILLKGIPSICETLFYFENECTIESREREILVFLAVVIVWKGRKASTSLHYISNVFFYSKICSTFLFLRADPLIGIIYGILCIVQLVVFPEPVYKGPEKVTYFQFGELETELKRDTRCAWVIQFYASWSAECRHFAPVFAQLSEQFSLPNLRFGKVDVGRWPKEAERWAIGTLGTHRQLPSLMFFFDGQMTRRRPQLDVKGRAATFTFNYENCVKDFDLYNVQEECRKRLKTKPSSGDNEKEKKVQ